MTGDDGTAGSSDAGAPDGVVVASLDDLAGGARPFGEREPTTVYLSLDEGEEVPSHDHPGRDVLFLVRSGRIDLRVDGEPTVLDAGEVARFPGERAVAPRGIEASRALVVLAPRADDGSDDRDEVDVDD